MKLRSQSLILQELLYHEGLYLAVEVNGFSVFGAAKAPQDGQHDIHTTDASTVIRSRCCSAQRKTC
jgi:hypothetical protein